MSCSFMKTATSEADIILMTAKGVPLMGSESDWANERAEPRTPARVRSTAAPLRLHCAQRPAGRDGKSPNNISCETPRYNQAP
jgi:hypothetical protein